MSTPEKYRTEVVAASRDAAVDEATVGACRWWGCTPDELLVEVGTAEPEMKISNYDGSPAHVTAWRVTVDVTWLGERMQVLQ